MLWVKLYFHRACWWYFLRETEKVSHFLPFFPASSNVPTSSGTSSLSSLSLTAALVSMLPIWVFKNWYYFGPTCLRISGIMSLSSLVYGVPATTRRFSLTENWAKNTEKSENKYVRYGQLTLWSLEMDDGVVVLEHVDLLDILELLHAYLRKKEVNYWAQNHLPNFLMVDLSFLSSLTSVWWTTFLVLLWVPEIFQNTMLGPKPAN